MLIEFEILHISQPTQKLPFLPSVVTTCLNKALNASSAVQITRTFHTDYYSKIISLFHQMIENILSWKLGKQPRLLSKVP